MAILKSSRYLEKCIASAVIFSGRPDPTWEVDDIIVKKLEEIWIKLTECRDKLPSVPLLGYRGCFIRCKNNVEWHVYGCVVTLNDGKKSKSRVDKDKKFERLLLSSHLKDYYQ